MQRKLIAFKRAPEIVGQFVPLVGSGLHVGFEKAHGLPRRLLGTIHCDVGVGHQAFPIPTVIGKDRNAGAGASRGLNARDQKRLEQLLFDLPDKIAQLPVIVEGDGGGELVTAQAGKEAVAAGEAGKAAADNPEFLRQIMAAGVACYSVFLKGRKVVYTGRDGDALTEPFPGGK